MSEFTCECCGRFRRDGWAATRAAVVQALEDTGGGVPTAANFWRAAAILAAETGVVHRIEWWRSHGFTIDGRPLDTWFADRVLRDAPELVQAHHEHGQPLRATGQCDRCREWTGGDFAWSGDVVRFEGCGCRQ